MLHPKIDQKSNRAKEAIKRLNVLLLQERRRSAIPWGRAAHLTTGSLLVLIDADSLGDEEIAEKITSLSTNQIPLSVHVCANRTLEKAERLSRQGLGRGEANETCKLSFHSVPQGSNRADLWLISVSEEAIQQTSFEGVIVLTQDRDLFPIIERWRNANRAGFISSLRLDESGRHLIQRCQQRGFTVIDCLMREVKEPVDQ